MMEERVNRVENQVARVFSDIKSIEKRMTRIEQSALQIKYSVFGAVGFFLLSQVGLVDFLKIAV
jgi:hypothetical protein